MWACFAFIRNQVVLSVITPHRFFVNRFDPWIIKQNHLGVIYRRCPKKRPPMLNFSIRGRGMVYEKNDLLVFFYHLVLRMSPVSSKVMCICNAFCKDIGVWHFPAEIFK